MNVFRITCHIIYVAKGHKYNGVIEQNTLIRVSRITKMLNLLFGGFLWS